jgi:outer membrane lipoprotein SlyB
MTKGLLSLALATALVSGLFQSQAQASDQAAAGGVIGAAAGAIIGGIVGGGDGALIGAGIGAATGIIAGQQMHINELRRSNRAGSDYYDRDNCELTRVTRTQHVQQCRSSSYTNYYYNGWTSTETYSCVWVPERETYYVRSCHGWR